MVSSSDDEIRVQLSVTRSAHPELFSRLANVKKTSRAEIIRTMATVGIAGIGGGISPALPQPTATVAEKKEDSVIAKSKSAIGGIKAGMNNI
jgi:hypothetical protein